MAADSNTIGESRVGRFLKDVDDLIAERAQLDDYERDIARLAEVVMDPSTHDTKAHASLRQQLEAQMVTLTARHRVYPRAEPRVHRGT